MSILDPNRLAQLIRRLSLEVRGPDFKPIVSLFGHPHESQIHVCLCDDQVWFWRGGIATLFGD